MTGQSAKDILLAPIPATTAANFVRRVHYSKKTVKNSQLHIGVYLRNRLEGVMQFGPPLDKSKILPLVEGTPWNSMIELNRMAFTENLPPNSESRAIAVSLRLIRRHAPHVKWVVSFADGTQCGDGTIYRAAGFLLTAITPSKNLARLPNGDVVHKMTIESSPSAPRPEAGGRSYYDVTEGRYRWRRYLDIVGGAIIPGHQLRYIGFVDRHMAEPTRRQTAPLHGHRQGRSAHVSRRTPDMTSCPSGVEAAHPPTGREGAVQYRLWGSKIPRPLFPWIHPTQP